MDKSQMPYAMWKKLDLKFCICMTPHIWQFGKNNIVEMETTLVFTKH